MEKLITKKTLVDWEKVSDHFKKLDRHGDLVLSLFPPTRGLPNIHYKCTTENIPKDAIERDLQKFQKHSLGYVVNPPKSQPRDWPKGKAYGASNDHISHAECLFLEGDSGEDPDQQQLAINKAGLPDPSMTIWTGGKSVHFFWFLEEKISPEKFREMMKRLAEKVDTAAPWLGVDKGIHNPCRVMRLRGGLHGKTKKPCELRSFSGIKYALDVFEKGLPLQNQEHKKIFSNRPLDQNGWFSKRPREEQHRLAVEMLGYLPRRNVEGKGERHTCISALYGLKNHFGESEASIICKEGNWFGNFWDPLKELPSLNNPTNSIGTFIELARQGGWELKNVAPLTSKIILEDLFPQDVVDALRTVTKFLPYPDVLIATTFLAACAGSLRLGSSINLNPLSDFVVPLNLYICTVGRTGTKKTPLQKVLIDNPTELIKDDLKRTFQRQLSEWLRGKASGKKAGRKPTRAFLTVKDITGEALEAQLQIQEEKQLGLLLCRDELVGVFKGMNQYKGGRGSDEQQLLELFDGNGFATIRKKETRSCEATHLVVYGGIQPDVLTELQEGEDFNGKWARFIFSPLIASPIKLATSFQAGERKAYETAKFFISKFIKELRAKSGFEYQLTNEAYGYFSEFEYQKQIQALASKRASHSAILNKCAGKVGRVAGLLHHIKQVREIPDAPRHELLPEEFGLVDVDTFRAAIALIEHLDDYAMTFETEANRSKLQKWMKRLHNIASKAKSPMSWSDIQRALSNQERVSLSKELREKVFEQLQETGLGKCSKGNKNGLFYKSLLPWPDDM